MARRKKYSEELIEYVREISEGSLRDEILEKTNSKFGLKLTKERLDYLMTQNRIKTGIKTSEQRKRPIGSERETGSRKIMIKIAEPSVWEYKHIVEWRKHYGEIPKGYVVSARNRDLRDTRIENLMLLTKQQVGYLSRKTLKDIDYINDDVIKLINFMIEIKKASEKLKDK
ncbi:HNH endonuclease signature motif containing protein [Macrococcoides caseolyticum]|uniref:HNH nuclease domain-containing protein n=1 Tax=Macrococcus caseolyticus (strain JCSC5402) TaxID=458233 RepID=B9EBP9_MACCJ|nr:HNH endonuclease signature motif containing protein [Macrococcus caseolyticus]BAH17660.1 hypothetical protein MCCL_0953 [Macrococcus caseolyticus JCSC5402]